MGYSLSGRVRLAVRSPKYQEKYGERSFRGKSLVTFFQERLSSQAWQAFGPEMTPFRRSASPPVMIL